MSAETLAAEKFRAFLRENREELRLIKNWGDGRCGALIEMLLYGVMTAEELVPRPPASSKRAISRALSKRVFERDGYRCVTCADHLDLTCDHVIPESKGGPTTFENLQTMCRICNCSKGAR